MSKSTILHLTNFFEQNFNKINNQFYNKQLAGNNLHLFIFLKIQFSFIIFKTKKKKQKKIMDFGGLDDILDDDIGYIPTAIKRDDKPRSRPASMSRQNSSRSIGSVKDQKDNNNTYGLTNRQNDPLFGLAKQSARETSFNLSPQPVPNSGRRSNMFSLHKQSAQQEINPNRTPISFEDFFKNQNNPTQNIQSLAKPPLPEPRNNAPERRLEKNSSYSQLQSPENILEDDLNNSSVASRRGRPPLSRKTQQNLNNENEVIGQNRSQNFATSSAFLPINDAGIGIKKNNSINISPITEKKIEPIAINQPLFQSFSQTAPINQPQIQQYQSTQQVNDNQIQQLKKLFSTQLDYQKQMFQTLMKQQRENHQQQLNKQKQFHKEQLKKKLQIKDFEIQKLKQSYQFQLKIQAQRQSEIKQYSSIAKKLQGNIQIIQKLQKNIKQKQTKDQQQRQEHTNAFLKKKQQEIKEKQTQLKNIQNKLEQELIAFRNEKLKLNQEINTQKNRIYQLEIQLRTKESELTLKYKKLQNKLNEQHQSQKRLLERQKQEIRMQALQLKQQKNIIQVQKLQLINSKKIWDNEKKAHLEQLHQQKTKVLQKQIEIASRTGQLEIKQQEIQMNQNDYLNKLKLVQLQKKKLDIEKKTSKGQFYFNLTSQSPAAIRTNGLLGTTLLMNKTSQSALNKEFYSNQDYEKEGFVEQQSNYKKSITQMRDEFLKSLPKF